MATSAQLTQLKQLYTGIFGHLPTRSALDWYATQIDALGLDTAGIANVLLYDDTQPGASNTFDYRHGDTDFVRQIYTRLFGWTPAALEEPVHQTGVKYWTDILQDHFSGDKGKLIETMLWVIETNGESSGDASTNNAYHLLENRVEVADFYAVSIAGESSDIHFLRQVVASVDSGIGSVGFAKATIVAAAWADGTLMNKPADQIIEGTEKDDFLPDGDGNDIVIARDGDDALGAVQALSASYALISYSSPGDDLLIGGKGADGLNGGQGNDILIDEEGRDLFNGDEGDDIMIGDSHDGFYGDSGNDVYYINAIQGDPADAGYIYDSNTANAGDDIIVISETIWKNNALQISRGPHDGAAFNNPASSLFLKFVNNADASVHALEIQDHYGLAAIEELRLANSDVVVDLVLLGASLQPGESFTL
jgi:Ca2+-binding RTX toxin-like protein